MFPLPLLWEAFFSGGGKLSRQMLQCLKTFSSSLLSGIMGLRAKLTQLSLVGKTFLSDTIPVKKKKKKQFYSLLIFCGVPLPTPHDLPFNVEQKPGLRLCWILLSCSLVPWTMHVLAVEHKNTYWPSFINFVHKQAQGSWCKKTHVLFMKNVYVANPTMQLSWF